MPVSWPPDLRSSRPLACALLPALSCLRSHPCKHSDAGAQAEGSGHAEVAIYEAELACLRKKGSPNAAGWRPIHCCFGPYSLLIGSEKASAKRQYAQMGGCNAKELDSRIKARLQKSEGGNSVP